MTLIAQTAVEVGATIDLVSELIKKIGIPGTVLIFIVVGGLKFIRWSKPHLIKCFDAFQDRQSRIAVSHENMANKSIEIQLSCQDIHRQNADVLKQGMETLKKNTDLTEAISNNLGKVCKGQPGGRPFGG